MNKFLKLLENEMDQIPGGSEEAPGVPEAPVLEPDNTVEDEQAMTRGDLDIARSLALHLPNISTADRVALSVQITDELSEQTVREKLHEILNMYDTP